MLEQHTLFPLSDAVKRCAQCKVAKPVTDFFKRRADSDDRVAYCKPCNTERCRIWRNANRDHANESKRRNRQKPEIKAQRAAYDRFYRAAKPEIAREKQRRYNERHVELQQERRREYSQKNRDVLNRRKRAWQAANAEHVSQWRRGRLQARFTADPMFEARYRLDLGMATAIGDSLRGTKRGRHWYDLVGYTLEDLMAHLESRFKPGMTWANRTTARKGGWHIDHIRPRSSFSYTSADDPEFKECWALSNLQPLWGIENLKKHAKWVDDSA